MSVIQNLKSRLSFGRLTMPRATVRPFLAIGSLLILSIVGMALMFTYVNRQAAHSKQYAINAGNQEVLSQQMTTQAVSAATGRGEAFLQLRRHSVRYQSLLDELQQGDPATGTPPMPQQLSADLNLIVDLWAQSRQKIDDILEGRASIETITGLIDRISVSLPDLIDRSQQIVALLEGQGSNRQLIIASQQLTLIQSIQNNMVQILRGGDDMVSAADVFGRDTALFERNLIGFLEGDEALGLEPISDAATIDALIEVANLYSVIRSSAGGILENSPALFVVGDASADFQLLGAQLLKAASDLGSSINVYDDRLRLFNFLGFALGAVALILMILLGLMLVRQASLRLQQSQEQNDRNQRAILRLLDEMGNLADGDLSTHTTVTEDITGAIADSVNFSIDALRDLVETINDTAVQVTHSVRETQSTTEELAEASSVQFKQITQASTSITGISKNIQLASETASESAEVARNSVAIAHDGGETVRRTIEGMEEIREQIQETSKRIKRLGESSQEIGDIVGLITEISDQTNILALNAAIQASMAGDAGRGFAVVADEVQRLAERTGEATKQIEVLVKTIQADTNEAISSMEQSTSNVVRGAQFAEDAGQALEKIEAVSTNLAQRILDVADMTHSQSDDAAQITHTMNDIEEITNQASANTQKTSESIGTLSSMVQSLRSSVAGFKLPGGHALDETGIYSADSLDLNIDSETERA